jgi:hypothetical protein
MTPTATQKWTAAGAAGAVAVYASVLRPRIQWLGTSHAERTATYPGDDLIPGGRRYGAAAMQNREVGASPTRSSPLWPGSSSPMFATGPPGLGRQG